jgi:hypothetical protein
MRRKTPSLHMIGQHIVTREGQGKTVVEVHHLAKDEVVDVDLDGHPQWSLGVEAVVAERRSLRITQPRKIPQQLQIPRKTV